MSNEMCLNGFSITLKYHHNLRFITMIFFCYMKLRFTLIKRFQSMKVKIYYKKKYAYLRNNQLLFDADVTSFVIENNLVNISCYTIRMHLTYQKLIKKQPIPNTMKSI